MPDAEFYTLYFWTNGYPQTLTSTTSSVTVSNLARRVTWGFAVSATMTNGVEIFGDDVLYWPPVTYQATNRVVAVSLQYREADALGGPWRTNSVEIYRGTNPPAASHFWQAIGSTITVTNY
ncbi:MAG: hypothetical protein U1F65_05715 [Verrucomicrobiota bacterium]